MKVLCFLNMLFRINHLHSYHSEPSIKIHPSMRNIVIAVMIVALKDLATFAFSNPVGYCQLYE